jgi:hypothetical protein
VQTLFTCLICLQFLVVVLHDLVDIPGWHHGSRVRTVVGPAKFWIGTVVNAIFPGVAVWYAIYWWGRTPSVRAADYWVIYCAITVASAAAMWWIPYFRGGSEKQNREYGQMYAGTRYVLPARGDNPGPNLLHLYFHVLFLATLGLAVALRFGRG